MLPHSRVELRRWFDSHKVGDCVAERGSGSTRDPLEALVTPLVIRPSVIEVVKPRRYSGGWLNKVPYNSTAGGAWCPLPDCYHH